MPFKHAYSNSTSIRGSVPNDTKVFVREFPSSVSHNRYGTTVLDDDSDVGVHPIISSIVQPVQNSPTLSGVLLSVMEIMDMLPTPPDAHEALAAIGHRIYRSFESLSHEDEDSFSSALVNESQRFGLWAKNIGLYNLGHSSLDYRFRNAPVVYEYTKLLLVDLEKSIWKSVSASFLSLHDSPVSFYDAILRYLQYSS